MKFFGRRAAYTLIELLVVMTIISILLGLVLAVAGPVRKAMAVYRTKAEVSAIELAMTRFEVDNGFFPDTKTTTISAMGTTGYNGDPAGTDKAAYENAGRTLFLSLIGRQYFNSTSTVNVGTQYLTDWKESQSGDPGTSSDLTAVSPAQKTSYPAVGAGSYLKDPFGFPYGYYYNYGSALPNGYSVFNQVTYDLWSTAGETKNPTGTDAYIAEKWVTNWNQR